MKLISLVSAFLSAVRRTSVFFLASIGVVIRVLGQGESLRTRGCVSVRYEGRASGFDVFEFRDREDVCGRKRKERSLKLVSSFLPRGPLTLEEHRVRLATVKGSTR